MLITALLKEAVVNEDLGNVHASLTGRYEKVATFIDAIQDANATIQGYLDTIAQAREAFADAISNNNNDDAYDSSATIDQTLSRLSVIWKITLIHIILSVYIVVISLSLRFYQ
ncbi:MAG: hypothetical protein H6688_00975 [Erysipelotrichaceae bacterium]|nr:hypothetical protein [Erysipelotrichaceae bacterium]